MRLFAPGALTARTDLVSGGPLRRELDGREYPLCGAMVVGGDKGALGVIAPEVFSVSAERDRVSLTLLRSPFVAHHDPFDASQRPDHPVTDQGAHEFDIVLWPGCPADLAEASALARSMLMPPICWELSG